MIGIVGFLIGVGCFVAELVRGLRGFAPDARGLLECSVARSKFEIPHLKSSTPFRLVFIAVFPEPARLTQQSQAVKPLVTDGYDYGREEPLRLRGDFWSIELMIYDF